MRMHDFPGTGGLERRDTLPAPSARREGLNRNAPVAIGR